MADLLDFTQRREKIKTDSMLKGGRMIDRAISLLLSSRYTSAHEIAGLLAHRLGAFLRAYKGNKAEMLRTVYDIVSRESQKPIDSGK